MSDYFTAIEMKDALDRQSDMYKDKNGDIDLTPTGNLQIDLDSVEEFVNSALRNKYKIPVTEIRGKNFARGMVLTLMREAAYSRLGTGTTPESVSDAGNRVRNTLGQLMTGARILQDVPEQPAGPVAETFATSAPVQMSRDNLKRY